MSNLWQVHTDKFVNEKESIMRNGNVYQIANGYMGYRGTLDEFGPEQLVGHHAGGHFRPRRRRLAGTGQRPQRRLHAGHA